MDASGGFDLRVVPGPGVELDGFLGSFTTSGISMGRWPRCQGGPRAAGLGVGRCCIIIVFNGSFLD